MRRSFIVMQFACFSLLIMESSGSGITVFDYDNDGHYDLYMMNGTWLEGISDPKGKVYRDTPNRLYRNLGDGTFEEAEKVCHYE